MEIGQILIIDCSEVSESLHQRVGFLLRARHGDAPRGWFFPNQERPVLVEGTSYFDHHGNKVEFDWIVPTHGIDLYDANGRLVLRGKSMGSLQTEPRHRFHEMTFLVAMAEARMAAVSRYKQNTPSLAQQLRGLINEYVADTEYELTFNPNLPHYQAFEDALVALLSDFWLELNQICDEWGEFQFEQVGTDLYVQYLGDYRIREYDRMLQDPSWLLIKMQRLVNRANDPELASVFQPFYDVMAERIVHDQIPTNVK